MFTIRRPVQRPKAFGCFTVSLANDLRHFESHFNLRNLYLNEEDFRFPNQSHDQFASVTRFFRHMHNDDNNTECRSVCVSITRRIVRVSP